jgi:glycosyltransferase involved in cell wall biosynthesis
MSPIPVHLGLQQRVLPFYRAEFFDLLAADCPQGLGVFAGQPRFMEALGGTATLKKAQLTMARNLHLFSGGAYLCLQPDLMRWLETWQPEVLIVEANPRYLSTPSAVRWMHARRRPVLAWGLGAPVLHGFDAGTRMLLRRRFLHQFDGLITYSHQGAEEYRQAGLAQERIFVAPNAATPRPTQPPPVRGEKYPDGAPTVLFVGRMQWRKRVDLLLKACAALPQGLKPHVWIVGDGPARAEFESLANEVYPVAQFLGARTGADLEPYLLNADLFVLPGTGGLAIQQAMSYALPVMVGEADGTQTDLVRPENGWQIPPHDLSALTGLLEAALSDVKRLRQMGLASYRIVSEEINLEAMVSVFEHAVCSVL